MTIEAAPEDQYKTSLHTPITLRDSPIDLAHFTPHHSTTLHRTSNSPLNSRTIIQSEHEMSLSVPIVQKAS